MHNNHNSSENYDAHLETLRAKHVALDAQLKREALRPGACHETIKKLKLRKLKLKERIEEKENVSIC